MTQPAKPPIKEFRVGNVKLPIWKNEITRNGQTVVQYSIKPSRSYRDKQTGEWKTTEHFFTNDLPKLILATQKAYEFCALKESEDLDQSVPAAAE